jgi:hypothetical protein
MEPALLVPLAGIVFFFWALVAITQMVSENRLRRRILDANPSPELVTAMRIPPKQDPGLTGSLKWGIVMSTVAVGIMVVGYFNIQETAFGFGVVLLTAGAGLLIYYAIAKRQYDRALENGYDISTPLAHHQRPVP